MKSSLLTFLLPLLIDGSVINLEPRQFGGLGSLIGSIGSGSLASVLPKRKAYKIEDLPPKLGIAGAKRVRVMYGPYVVKGTKTAKGSGNAKSMDAGGTSYMNDVDTDFPRDITILKSSAEVQTKDGKRIELKDGLYNHHTTFFDITKSNPSPFDCASKKIGFNMGTIPVFAAGAMEDNAQIFMSSSGTLKSGYYLRKTGPIVNIIDMVNYNEKDQEVYTSTEMEYIPGKPDGYRDAYMTLVDPGLCGGANGAAIHPPKGVNKFSINSTDIIMARSGYIVYTVGHMHDGGVNVFLKVNDDVKCDSKAQYGGAGHSTVVDGKTWDTIKETTPCSDVIRVQKGDRIYMQANYDTELHPSREMGGGHSGMGGMKWAANALVPSSPMDGGDAEQMALFVAYFTPDP